MGGRLSRPALREQGIGGNVLARDRAVGEQRDRHADLIGPLERVTAGYRQRADFISSRRRQSPLRTALRCRSGE